MSFVGGNLITCRSKKQFFPGGEGMMNVKSWNFEDNMPLNVNIGTL